MARIDGLCPHHAVEHYEECIACVKIQRDGYKRELSEAREEREAFRAHHQETIDEYMGDVEELRKKLREARTAAANPGYARYTMKIKRLQSKLTAAEEQAAEYKDKALRFDLDEAGIRLRESEAAELVELRGRIEDAEDVANVAKQLFASVAGILDVPEKLVLSHVEKLRGDHDYLVNSVQDLIAEMESDGKPVLSEYIEKARVALEGPERKDEETIRVHLPGEAFWAAVVGKTEDGRIRAVLRNQPLTEHLNWGDEVVLGPDNYEIVEPADAVAKIRAERNIR